MNSSETTIETGISIGCALTMILSWYVNKSIIWCVIHGIFSWLYVIYFAITKTY